MRKASSLARPAIERSQPRRVSPLLPFFDTATRGSHDPKAPQSARSGRVLRRPSDLNRSDLFCELSEVFRPVEVLRRQRDTRAGSRAGSPLFRLCEVCHRLCQPVALLLFAWRCDRVVHKDRQGSALGLCCRCCERAAGEAMSEGLAQPGACSLSALQNFASSSCCGAGKTQQAQRAKA